MNNRFPKVGVIGAGEFARMMVAPATALGVDLLLFASDSKNSGAQITHHYVGDYRNLIQVLDFAKKCDVVTFEDGGVPLSVIKGLESAGVKVYPSSAALIYSQDKGAMREKLSSFLAPESPTPESPTTGDFNFIVTVARSPHGQATSWAPTEIVREAGRCIMTVTPAQNISDAFAEQGQKVALEVAQKVGLVGVMSVEISLKGEDIYLSDLVMHPDDSGLWSIEGSVTSQFEQHLRAILDLPLGSPEMNQRHVVTGIVLSGDKTDMYRPYLHLMARNPALHFHQNKIDVQPGSKVGHVSACGDNLPYLIQEIEHARDYISGAIDE